MRQQKQQDIVAASGEGTEDKCLEAIDVSKRLQKQIHCSLTPLNMTIVEDAIWTVTSDRV